MIDGEMMWKETAVTHMNLKSFIARVTKAGSQYKVLGVVLNDGTPIKSVEVKVDDGPWQTATLDPSTKEKYGWKLFTYNWTGATPGEHTLVSRVTDVNGRVQRTAQDNETKKSFLEEDSQAPRKVRIAWSGIPPIPSEPSEQEHGRTCSLMLTDGGRESMRQRGTRTPRLLVSSMGVVAALTWSGPEANGQVESRIVGPFITSCDGGAKCETQCFLNSLIHLTK